MYGVSSSKEGGRLSFLCFLKGCLLENVSCEQLRVFLPTLGVWEYKHGSQTN